MCCQYALCGVLFGIIILFSQPALAQEKETVSVLIWSGGSWAGFGSGSVLRTPNYLGHEVQKQECPVNCIYHGDRSRQGEADGIIFEAQPLASYGDAYLREPIPFPQKRPGQYYINYGYEQQFYFPLYADKDFLVHQDLNMTYDQKGAVPITFTCSWGGGSIDDFLKPHPPKKSNIAFMATNCGGGGASFRTIYLKELMKHIKVDSLGGCLHNTDLPEEMRKPIYNDHGTSMRWKIQVFKDYKYVLTFENNNVTDYVTEKLPCTFAAGALPIYMGAPNIEDWLPGEHSIINTADFANPKELADYINYLNQHDDLYEEYFAWKNKGLSENFKDKYNKCVFYGAECRLCQKLAELRRERKKQMEILDSDLPSDSRNYGESGDDVRRGYALFLDGKTYVQVPHHDVFNNMATSFSIGVWFQANRERSMVLVNKNTPTPTTTTIASKGSFFNGDDDNNIGEAEASMDGFSLDLQYIGTHHYVRLCAGYRCVLGTRPLSKDTWYYVMAIFSQGEEGIKIYVNGFLDVAAPMFATTKTNSLPIYFGGSPTTNEDEMFLGRIDDVSLWSIPLDEVRVKKCAFERMTGNEKGLLGYWSFNEASGNTVHDQSYLQKHGEVHGQLNWEDSQLKPLALNPCW